jgi:hypothetical protein
MLVDVQGTHNWSYPWRTFGFQVDNHGAGRYLPSLTHGACFYIVLTISLKTGIRIGTDLIEKRSRHTIINKRPGLGLGLHIILQLSHRNHSLTPDVACYFYSTIAHFVTHGKRDSGLRQSLKLHPSVIPRMTLHVALTLKKYTKAILAWFYKLSVINGSIDPNT